MFVNAATADAKWGLILCEIAEGPISGAFSLSAEEEKANTASSLGRTKYPTLATSLS